MKITVVFYVMLLVHVLGDFYFQSDSMAEKKREAKGGLRYVIKHLIIYSLTTFVGIMISVENNASKWGLFVGISIMHCLIDLAKFYIQSVRYNGKDISRKVFFIDQAVHLASLILVWFWFGQNAIMYHWVTQEWAHLPYLPVSMVLGLLLNLKPASIIIVNSGILKSAGSKDNKKEVGKYIGYLERIVIYGILIYGDFSALGFVLTAKSLARFAETKESENAAEYYILGTLLSITISIAIAVLLGHCTNVAAM